jgi:hypothetical protein
LECEQEQHKQSYTLETWSQQTRTSSSKMPEMRPTQEPKWK